MLLLFFIERNLKSMNQSHIPHQNLNMENINPNLILHQNQNQSHQVEKNQKSVNGGVVTRKVPLRKITIEKESHHMKLLV